MALVDWDGDGDLDVWVTNRTAPMLRYLENRSQSKNRFLSIKLEGRGANRDAVGARVEVLLKGQTDKPLVQTVKAGEGYLGQSSRALHFGLGAKGEIERVQIAWPGGGTEHVDGASANTFYRFREGDVALTTLPRSPSGENSPRRAPDAPPQPLPAEPTTLAGAAVLQFPLSMPTLPTIDSAGEPWTVSDRKGPLLVNVFASWCGDCVTELEEWSQAARRFAQAGVSVVLLSADGREAVHDTTPASAMRWLREKNVPFAAGTLTDECFQRINDAHELAFGVKLRLPVPTSLLLDGQGRLAAVYRGRVSVNRVLKDVTALTEEPLRRLSTTLPFQGRWLQPAAEPDPSRFLILLAGRQQWTDALAYFQRHDSALSRHREFAGLSAAFANKLHAAGHLAGSIAVYESASRAAPENPTLLNNLAHALAGANDKSLRDPERAVELARRAVALTSSQSAVHLDTLAFAQAATGDFAAASVSAAKAHQVAQAAGETELLAVIEKALTAYRAGKMH